MGDVLGYLYTVLTRIWDIISYPFEMVEKLVTFINNCWVRVGEVAALFPAWAAGSIVLVFALGVVLFVLKR